MPKHYSQQCKHIMKTGARCQRTTDGELCSNHRKLKELVYTECQAEECTKLTMSKYGFCSSHSSKLRAKTYYEKIKPAPTIKVELVP